MHIAITSGNILLLCAVFLLGGMIAERSDEWSAALDPEPRHQTTLRKSFFLTGKIIQAGAAIWVVMNALTLISLASRL